MKKIVFFLVTFCIMASYTYAEVITTKSGLRYEDHTMGTGKEAVTGKRVDLHYTGWLEFYGNKGKKFDSSHDRGMLFFFTLGDGTVIKGLDEGVTGMNVGGKRTLYIPSKLGYGSQGAGKDIPPYADLIFDIELKKVSSGK